ncbi:Pilin/Flagellin, FlaG/FlaF family [Halapricum desulfuricans]|uniref:Pilin/Flagellin, FlaG/FlaF family n=1 Tax=Halapricum desulfuricans TaxID=2841257 RepID=A0A897NI00_9EURY|nr:Pilin/Flagellin, FlaG/FlaF family [Halapricum desulfuricans]
MIDSRRRGETNVKSVRGNNRGLSTPVTHVLTIGITGVLLVLLLSTANGFLTDQQEYAAQDELNTIGNRLADDIQKVVALSEQGGSVTVTVEHPDAIAGNEYRVSYENTAGACAGVTDTCLAMSVVGQDVSQTVPLSVPSDVSADLTRSGSEFILTATKTSGGSSSGAVVPMTRTMRIGVGQDIDRNKYGEVIDPTNRPPIPKFTFSPDFPESGTPVYFDAADSRDPDGTIVDYEWHIDGSLEHSGSETYSTSLSPGKHNVTLQVEDDEGARSTRTRLMRVSGLAYNDDFTSGAGGGSRCGGVGTTFSVTNEWGDAARVTHLSINPAADVKNINKLEYKNGSEIAFDTDGDGVWDREYEFGSIDLRDKPDGTIVRLRSAEDEFDNDPVVIDPSETVTVSMCKYKGGGNVEDTAVGLRYWVNGATNRTVVDPERGYVSSYDVEAVSDDIVVSFDSTRQLGSLNADIDSGEEIELTVYGEPNSGSVKSDSVTLDDADSGSGTVTFSGINKDADTFWIEAELRSLSPKRSPELQGVVLEEGS